MKTLTLKNQALLLLLSALPFWAGIYLIIPFFVDNGISLPIAFSVGLIIPLILLFVFTGIGIRSEKSLTEKQSAFKRLNLKVMTRKDWGWTGILLLITLAGYFILGFTSDLLSETFSWLNPPSEFNLVQTDETFFGFNTKGNWWILVFHLGLLLVNIFGEELWFRGYLFPRQQLTYAKKAWIYHGLFYHIFHLFYPWDIIRLLPESLAYGYVIQKTNNTWVTVISHFIFNGLGLVVTIIKIVN